MKKDNQTVFLAVHLPSQLINQLPVKVSNSKNKREHPIPFEEYFFNASTCLFNIYECIMCMHAYVEER